MCRLITGPCMVQLICMASLFVCAWVGFRDPTTAGCQENVASKKRCHGYEQYCKWCGYVVNAMACLSNEISCRGQLVDVGLAGLKEAIGCE